VPEEIKHCPLCGAAGRRLFDQRAFRDHPVTNHLCANCGLVYQSPRMTPAELEAFYAHEYRSLYQGSEGPGRKDLLTQRGRAESLLHFVQTRIPGIARHLDIGASAGTLALRFQAHFGGTAIGVEPGSAYRQFAAAQGLTVYATLEELAARGEADFDLISLAHVLEHLPDPVGELNWLRKEFLAPDGWLLVEVPNLYAHNCFEVAHLTSFSPHTLRQTLQKAGFTIDDFLQHGQPRSVVLPLYLTVLARPLAAPLPPEKYSLQREHGVALKRRLGMARRRLLQRLFPSLAWIPQP
jgi:SAM-dependent methyltransferase